MYQGNVFHRFFFVPHLHECVLLPLVSRAPSSIDDVGGCCSRPSGLTTKGHRRHPLGALKSRRAKHVHACVHLLVAIGGAV